ncbi:MAG TPA: hypothetical protein VK869_12265 [Rubrobacteraceae bacterium]|nr:hypothetical protein [Rubrobacteraceae bacterium]
MSHRAGDYPWRRFLASAVGLMIVFVYAAGVGMTYLLGLLAGLPNDDFAQNLPLIAGFGAFAVVGAILVAARPANAVGWIMAAVPLLLGVFLAGDAYAAYVVVTRGQPDALAVVSAWAGTWSWYVVLALAVIYLPLFFPEGRLPSRRWLPVAVVPGIGVLSMVVLAGLAETLQLNEAPGYEIGNPVGIEGLAPLEDLPIFFVFTGLLMFGIIGAVASVVLRFRRSRGVERQQMKWFVYAAALLPIIPGSDLLPTGVDDALFAATLLALPTAVGIAVLRYRLYDIDLLINRTLVYGSLTATLALVYLGGVAATEGVFRYLTGQLEQPQLAVVATTLVIAALFNPLRRRIQAVIDRRFYRRKYDAAKTLAAFSGRLREETNLGALSDEMLSVVRDTVQPVHASLWLRDARAPEAPEGEPSDESRA